MNALALAAWLTLGWLPQGGVLAYQPPEGLFVDNTFTLEIGVEATWGPFFTGGSVWVPTWKVAGGYSFFPYQLSSTVDVGLEWGPVRLGWKHDCAHPVTPYVGMWQGQLVPYFDGWYDMVYLTISTRVPR